MLSTCHLIVDEENSLFVAFTNLPSTVHISCCDKIYQHEVHKHSLWRLPGQTLHTFYNKLSRTLPWVENSQVQQIQDIKNYIGLLKIWLLVIIKSWGKPADQHKAGIGNYLCPPIIIGSDNIHAPWRVFIQVTRIIQKSFGCLKACSSCRRVKTVYNHHTGDNSTSSTVFVLVSKIAARVM